MGVEGGGGVSRPLFLCSVPDTTMHCAKASIAYFTNHFHFLISLSSYLQADIPVIMHLRHLSVNCLQVGCQAASCTGFCRIFATELEDRRPKTVPYLEEVVE